MCSALEEEDRFQYQIKNVKKSVKNAIEHRNGIKHKAKPSRIWTQDKFYCRCQSNFKQKCPFLFCLEVCFCSGNKTEELEIIYFEVLS